MAAYAALVSLMHIIDDIQHHHSPPISLHKQQVQSLTEIVTFLQEFLEGYQSPVADVGDEADPLEMRIADAAYSAEDLIESRIVEKIQLSRSKESKINRFLNCFRGVDANHDDEGIKCLNLYEDLQQVIEEMNSIKKVAMEIDSTEKVGVVHNHEASVASLRSSSSSTGKNSSIGMVCSDDVLNGIMEKLVRGRLDRQVIPIVGMGGIGKTTLARNVYSKPLIKDHFVICAWATISQKYNTREILCELLSQTTRREKEEPSDSSEVDTTKREKEKLSDMSEDELGLELSKYLVGRKFLIVMDDMWCIHAWDKIQHCFPNNENGSRVLVTTRLSQLSSQLNNNYSLQMEFLDEVSSWNLFSKIVFGEESCPHELEKIGKKIVENCRGLPLAIVVVGGLLKKVEHDKRYWESIWNNLTSAVNLENDKHCLRLLKMSYNHLPVYLKPCFLYMGVFEEDDEIRVSTLIKLWVCEGFLKPIEGKSLEAIAIGFLKDLIDRNLIQIHMLGSTGRIKYCKIHDLLRDLCLNEGKRDGFYHVVGQRCPRGINSQRRVVIPRNTSKKKVLGDLQSMPHTRSIFYESGKVPRCQNLGLLRTFHGNEFHYLFEDKSNENSLHVLQYFNLRHLAVQVRSMSSFFSSASFLWSLHTLIVCSSHEPSMPIEIWKMLQLRHIEFAGRTTYLPDPPSDDVVIMENLQILKGIKNFKCSDEVVKRIPNIKKLNISYDGRDDYYCLSNIKHLCKLESLRITFVFYLGTPAILHKLTFPHSLKSLTLAMNHRFEWEDILEKIGSLPLLEKLQLWTGCFRTGKWEIDEGQFPSLKYLGFFSCNGLKHLTVEESSVYPCLEVLYLFDMGELEDIASEIGNIPTLRKIRLQYCSESAVKSLKDMVEEQVEVQGDQLSFHVEVSLVDENDVVGSIVSKYSSFLAQRELHVNSKYSSFLTFFSDVSRCACMNV